MRLIVDGDLLQRRPCHFRILGGDDGHRLTRIAHHIDRKHGLVLDVEPEGFLARHIGVRQNRLHAGSGRSGGSVDGRDPGVWMRATKRGPVEHPVPAQVARVLEITLHLGYAIDSAD